MLYFRILGLIYENIFIFNRMLVQYVPTYIAYRWIPHIHSYHRVYRFDDEKIPIWYKER